MQKTSPTTDEIHHEIQAAVLEWATIRLRDLPWRRTRDPWAVLLAEVMLQQTQVHRAIPKWEGFLEAYPTPAACAAGSLGDVLRLWQGLGYPRRARNVHLTAQIVTREHHGRIPDDLESLLALPGIGPYTARAVLAFAYERDVGVVDTNIARVLARTGGERLSAGRAQALADGLVPKGHGWFWNQALMDLGATVCRPAPQCHECPVSAGCRWWLAGRPAPDPAAGSAGVSGRQAPFEGSARQERGRVLQALHHGPRPRTQFRDEIIVSLLADGLVVERPPDTLALP